MKPIETARFAVAACNISLCRGTAKLLPLTIGVAEHVANQIRTVCKEHNVHINMGAAEDEITPILSGMLQERILAGLKSVEEHLAGADLPAKFYSKLARVREVIAQTPFDAVASEVRLEELTHDLIDELSEPVFLQIEPELRKLYAQDEPAFGPRVDAAFPDAKSDIVSAARCLALDEWTASVFHVMRVLEHGLRALAAKMQLSPDAMAHENWRNVIDQIEKKIREMEALPKSAHKTETLQQLSAAAVQFRYFKDAWRNHVMHARATYDGREATSAYNHTREFMQHLADLA